MACSNLSFLAWVMVAFFCLPDGSAEPAASEARSHARPASQSFDVEIQRNAERMLKEGKQIFRFDTFGSEEFWGGKLRLHEVLAGEKLGGVGPGVSPKTALALGLKSCGSPAHKKQI